MERKGGRELVLHRPNPLSRSSLDALGSAADALGRCVGASLALLEGALVAQQRQAAAAAAAGAGAVGAAGLSEGRLRGGQQREAQALGAGAAGRTGSGTAEGGGSGGGAAGGPDLQAALVEVLGLQAQLGCAMERCLLA